ncbi:hypothetical protein WME90_45300 [Sorangium sp. So ce375]|uniref:hypothetical protein n=1 Tax=Sorangium sp. So ce375 TaxID=3133306 RepID=UPI003F5B1FF8
MDEDELEDIRQLRIQWQSVDAPVIAVLLDAVPTSEDEFRSHAVWAGSRRAEDVPYLAWEDGFKVVPEVEPTETSMSWTPLPTDYAPSGRLFLVLQALERGELTAISDLIEIAVDKPFLAAGARCKSAPGEGSECDRPDAPQVCWQGSCREVCASDRDCPRTKPCEPPRGGIRLCAL